ncbi:glutathione S-transferase family protein [Paracoccus sp. S3-43]|uniref:glutathione S-transferase family protein n=1 Tax=Paracoccus sp. S3-43 TaxID=3030011 RepID=UPI0023AE70FB|nr:glutathione S-transferase family protein [Paracoccus sp. S3-43]WEF23902.1 glutathione S-transferase family protein [Paracoccus sp. S3-43]
MSLTLYGHPLSSYCQKVLVALHELSADFTCRHIDLSAEEDRRLMARLTPMGKMPALRDEAAGVTLAETSIIIEWLDRHHPGPVPLLPRDPDAALPARQWDRFFDIHVMNAAQPMVDARLFMAEGAVDVVAPFARSQLDRAYAAADRQLAGRDWIAGDFGMADCAAVPALFYAGFLHPFDAHPNLSAYFERLLARPSVARVLDEAKPWLRFFPFPDRIPARFR